MRRPRHNGALQTEIHALTAPERMDDLGEIIERAFVPYFDLERRVAEAEAQWIEAAWEAIDAQVDADRLAPARTPAQELRAAVGDLHAELEAIAADFELPPMEVPEPEIDEDATSGSRRPRCCMPRRGRGRRDRRTCFMSNK